MPRAIATKFRRPTRLVAVIKDGISWFRVLFLFTFVACSQPVQATPVASKAAPDSAGRTAHLLALMKKGDDGFNQRDFTAMSAVHHQDMIAHIPGSTSPIRGRSAHAATMKEMFRIFPDVHVYNEPYAIQFGSGDWITVVTRITGTFRGEMRLPGGKVIPPTGKAFDLTFNTTAKWEGDVLLEEYVFWDSALQAQQLGLGPT